MNTNSADVHCSMNHVLVNLVEHQLQIMQLSTIQRSGLPKLLKGDVRLDFVRCSWEPQSPTRVVPE